MSDLKPAEIGEIFYPSLGRVVVKFAALDDNLAMAIYTLLNTEPVSHPTPQITSISGPMPQELFRVLISSVPTTKRAEMMRELAKQAFPNKKEDIDALFKEIKSAIEDRNAYMHHVWHSAGQIGFSLKGKPTTATRTSEEIIAFGDKLVDLAEQVTFLHSKLLGLQ
jgi:hypothetical protein